MTAQELVAQARHIVDLGVLCQLISLENRLAQALRDTPPTNEPTCLALLDSLAYIHGEIEKEIAALRPVISEVGYSRRL